MKSFKKPQIILLIIAAVLILLFLSGKLSKNSYLNPLTPEEPEPNRAVYLGFWTQGLWDDQAKTLHPEKLKELEKKINKKAAIAHYFRGWEYLQDPTVVEELNTLSKEGWRPMISVNPYFFEDCQSKGMTLYKAIMVGNCDEVMRNIGRNLKNVKDPFFLRFAWEMNVPTIEWSIQKTASWNEEYKNAWIRFHNILKEEGAANAIWVFAPQIESPSTIEFDLLYPGEEYVDWVGLDGYNWGDTQSWSNWQDFSTVFLNSYNKLRTIAPGKPFMLSEVNTTDIGGNKGLWYKDMLTHQIPEIFTNIDAIVFFNEDKTKQEKVNWLIDASPDALKDFKTAISNKLYISNFSK